MACYTPIIVKKIIPGKKLEFEKTTNKQAKYILNHGKKYNDLIPCRKCIGCKIKKSKEWGIRAEKETKYHENNVFITLTYNNENLPKNKLGIPTIKQKDLTTFINSIRKNQERKGEPPIKYIASAEYGTKTKRPHYHICFFGLKINDLKESKEKSKKGHKQFKSKSIEKTWNKGLIEIGTVTQESAEYTTKYTIKKNNEKINYEKLEIEPEKTRMSKGIGEKWLQDNIKKIYDQDEIWIKGKKHIPPEYYDRKLKKINEQKWIEIKTKRKHQGEIKQQEKLKINNKLLTEQLGKEQEILWEKIKKTKTKLR